MPRLAPKSRKELLETARQAVAAAVGGLRYRPREPADPALQAPGGAFVTLHRDGALRGCIGNFQSEKPLYQTVAAMARAAALEDPRFPPVRAEELPEVDLEISVLSPLEQVQDPGAVEVGRHGVYMVRGYQRGVLLPQVATEQGWDRVRFLRETCRKAGLPPDAWQSGATIYVFEAEVFGEREEPR